jgi:hypothetical protein
MRNLGNFGKFGNLVINNSGALEYFDKNWKKLDF